MQTTYRVSHLSDPRQVATSLNIARRKTDALDLSSDQQTLLVDRATDAAGTFRVTTGTTPLTGQGVEITHNGLTGAAGIGTVSSYDRSSATAQTLNIVGSNISLSGAALTLTGTGALTFSGTSIVLQVAGVTTATVDATSINLASGMVLKNNGTQVVGPRSTGWTADTGTAEKGAHATYTAGSTLTFTDPPTAAEMSALATRLAAVETALQGVTRGQKAIKDSLTNHGLVGT